jgi:hypothetical protein
METITEQTRNAAYLAIIDKLPNRRKTVYNLIANYNGLNCDQISRKMVLKITNIGARVNELSHLRLIKVGSIEKNNRTNVDNVKWVITDALYREEMLKRDKEFYENQLLRFRIDSKIIGYEATANLIKKEIKKIEKRLILIGK